MDAPAAWYTWVFSGFGVVIVGWLLTQLWRRIFPKKEMKSTVQTVTNSTVSGIVAAGDVNIGTYSSSAPSSAVSSWSDDEYHRTPTPKEMHEEIQKVAMLSRETIARSYSGIKVHWSGVVGSVRQLNKGEIEFVMDIDGEIACMKVSLTTYPRLRTFKGNEPVEMYGTIDWVQTNGPVHIKDGARLVFNAKKPDEPPERFIKPVGIMVNSRIVDEYNPPIFAIKDRVRIIGEDKVGIIEQTREFSLGFTTYCVEYDGDAETRRWVKASELIKVY
jgi:hypothetical protein